MSKIHIGQKIKEVLKKSPYRHSEFAAMISMSRDGVYKIFEKESVATDLLQKISQVLRHDFFTYYQTELNLVSEPKAEYGYASKQELAEVTHLVHSLARQIGEMRDDLVHLLEDKNKASRTAKKSAVKKPIPLRKKAGK